MPPCDPLAFIEKGYSVFPLRGKQPLTPHGFKDATTDPQVVAAWEKKYGDKITGWGSADALVIDADGPTGIASYGEMVERHGDLGTGPRVKTPGGGLHDYRSNPDGLPSRKVAPGLETRGEGGYVVLPGSTHPNGGVYEGDLPPLAELPPPPAWVAEAKQSRQLDLDSIDGGRIPAGEPRHPHLLDLIGSLRGQGFGDDAIRGVARAFNETAFEEPIPTADLEGRVQRMLDKFPPGDLYARLGLTPRDLEDEPVERAADLFYAPTERRRASYDPPAILGLFYLGQRHVVFGEPESGKTWLLLAAVAEELKAGHDVLWIDTDDMGDSPLVDRLVSLGATEEAIEEHLLYAQPEGRLTDRQVEEMAGLARDRGVRLVVFDSFNATMMLEGLDPNSVLDVEAFLRKLASPVCREGAAFIAADHVVKNQDNRNGSPSGSERKRSGVTAMLEMRVVEPFGRSTTGRAKLVVQKDRPGHLAPRGYTVGIFELSEHDGRTTFQIAEAHERADDGAFRPTALMERVSLYLEEMPDAVTKRAVMDGVSGKSRYKTEALDRLVAEGYVERTPGARGAQWHRSVRPYREGLSETMNDRYPTATRPLPTRPLPATPPYRGSGQSATQDGETLDKSGGWD